MAQLHEVLAVDKDLEHVATKVLDEAINTFTKKVDHFLGNVKSLQLFDDARKKEEEGFKEVKEVTTTVPAKLDYVAESFVRYVDAVAQKEATNQIAKADLIVNGEVLAKDVPATLLLSLESKLAKWRAMYEAIPTLTPGIKWVPDETKGGDIYKAEKDEVRHKTEKVLESKILVAATDKFPAQIEKWTEDRPVGQYVNVRWSSMITPARKSELLGRIDSLLQAVKKARMRANTAEVVPFSIGKELVDFING